MDFSLTLRDIVLLALFILVNQGIPWGMRVLFPSVWGDKVERRKSAEVIRKEEEDYRRKMESKELEIKRSIAERELENKKEIAARELELKREIAERDAIIEARNQATLDKMEKTLSTLTDAIGQMSMRFSTQVGEFVVMRKEQAEYFSEGRKAIAQIESMSKQRNAQSE